MKFLNYVGLQFFVNWIKNTFLQKADVKIEQIKRNGTVLSPTDSCRKNDKTNGRWATECRFGKCYILST